MGCLQSKVGEPTSPARATNQHTSKTKGVSHNEGIDDASVIEEEWTGQGGQGTDHSIETSPLKKDIECPKSQTETEQVIAEKGEPSDEADIKSKYQWEKPAWAQASSSSNNEKGIITDSIKNNMLKSSISDGYVRQVKPTENQSRVDGTFVSAFPGAPPPRMAWIVVNIDGKKVGKIVMHLYGRDVNDLVDQFDGLKGHKLERRKNRPLIVAGIQPVLYITRNRPIGYHKKKDVYGIVIENHDIIDVIRMAKDDADIEIRQAHIYPVKKAKPSS